MGIEKYSVETIKPQKLAAIWAVDGNRIYPICYLQKPKWMTEKQFEKVKDAIRLDAHRDLLDAPDTQGMGVK